MPRGIPKAGHRAPGGGRQRKFVHGTESARVPLGTRDKVKPLFEALADLQARLEAWEKKCEEKKTSPRYEQARKLVEELKNDLAATGIDFASIFEEGESE